VQWIVDGSERTEHIGGWDHASRAGWFVRLRAVSCGVIGGVIGGVIRAVVGADLDGGNRLY
jgi:hypothetical protein